MASKLEKIEENKVKITVDVSPAEFEKAVGVAYLKSRGKINMPGFRKGKAPRKLIEVQYGPEVFYEDAINEILPATYEAAVLEHKLETVAKPEIDVTEAGKEKGAIVTFEVYTKPVIKIGKYSGLKYKKPETLASDEEINAVIDKNREKNSRTLNITDRPIQNGDIAVIDFEGFVDGTPFPGGKGEDYSLTIGSHSFIDNFEEQLIGKNIGDNCEINVTFPVEYGHEALASKPALFEVLVKSISVKELPEVNDEFAQDISEFDTLEAYKNDIRSKIEKRKADEGDRDVENQVVRALVDTLEMNVPAPMYENEIDRMVQNMDSRMKSQGLNLEQYLEYTGSDEKTLRDSYKETAEYNVKGRLAVEAVADKENFDVSEADIEEEMKSISEIYGIELDKFKKSISASEKEGMAQDIKMKKALEKLISESIAE